MTLKLIGISYFSFEGQPGTKREHLSHREHQVVVPRNSHQSKSFMKTVIATTNINDKKHVHLGNHVLEKSSITNGMSSSTEEHPETSSSAELEHPDKEIPTKKKNIAPQAISLLNNGWEASDEAKQQQTEKKKLREQILQGWNKHLYFLNLIERSKGPEFNPPVEKIVIHFKFFFVGVLQERQNLHRFH